MYKKDRDKTSLLIRIMIIMTIIPYIMYAYTNKVIIRIIIIIIVILYITKLTETRQRYLLQ